jgi:aldehyde dehydrogenase (NAD+)
VRQARKEGNQVFGGERQVIPNLEAGYYVRPALVEMLAKPISSVRDVRAYSVRSALRDLDEAIALNNDVTRDFRHRSSPTT